MESPFAGKVPAKWLGAMPLYRQTAGKVAWGHAALPANCRQSGLARCRLVRIFRAESAREPVTSVMFCVKFCLPGLGFREHFPFEPQGSPLQEADTGSRAACSTASPGWLRRHELSHLFAACVPGMKRPSAAETLLAETGELPDELLELAEPSQEGPAADASLEEPGQSKEPGAVGAKPAAAEKTKKAPKAKAKTKAKAKAKAKSATQPKRKGSSKAGLLHIAFWPHNPCSLKFRSLEAASQKTSKKKAAEKGGAVLKKPALHPDFFLLLRETLRHAQCLAQGKQVSWSCSATSWPQRRPKTRSRRVRRKRRRRTTRR